MCHLAPDQYAACSLLVCTWFNDSTSFANACFKVWFDIDSMLVHGWFSDGARLVRIAASSQRCFFAVLLLTYCSTEGLYFDRI